MDQDFFCLRCTVSGTVDSMKQIAATIVPLLALATFFFAIVMFWGTVLSEPECPEGSVYDPQTHMCLYPPSRCDRNPLVCPPLWFGGL